MRTRMLAMNYTNVDKCTTPIVRYVYVNVVSIISDPKGC